MGELTHKAIDGIRAELAAQVERTNDWRARAAQAELETSEQRTRAEAAEAELRELQEEVDEVASACGRWKPLTDSVGAAVNEMVNELQALTAELEKASELRKLVDAWKAAHDESMSTGLAVDAAAFYAAEEALRHA